MPIAALIGTTAHRLKPASQSYLHFYHCFKSGWESMALWTEDTCTDPHMCTLTHTEPPNVKENVRSDEQDEQITLLQWRSEASKQQQGIVSFQEITC